MNYLIKINFMWCFSSSLFYCATGIAISARILGGDVAASGEAPYIASIRSGILPMHFCGGALLNKRFVVTAAHCLSANTASRLQVVLGTNHLDKGGKTYKVSSIQVHPRYNNKTNVNDIGLMKLATDVQFTSVIQPIKLSPTRVEDKIALTVFGWGVTKLTETTSKFLKKLSVLSLSHKRCSDMMKSAHPKYPQIVPSELCAMQSEDNSVCYGDSGGPLVMKGGLVGIVSWGDPCGRGTPDVYTRISSYRTHILNIVNAKPMSVSTKCNFDLLSN